jgi:hypothetical protein
MTPYEFIFWLKGFLEFTKSLDNEEVDRLRKTLNDVRLNFLIEVEK